MTSNLQRASTKRARARLIRRYGFGVPDLSRALRSANDALTLIAQDVIHPFMGGTMYEMHLYDLPWPKDALGELGDVLVRLRVTLSYFIEPNPGQRGWRNRQHYASHRLRFEVKEPTESIAEFRKRMNLRALEKGEKKPPTNGSASRWYLGKNNREKGSIHSDVFEGTAAELADRGVIGVYPLSGWWKEQPKRDRSQKGVYYALIVSIETEATNVDIWTPVAEKVGVPAEVIVGA